MVDTAELVGTVAADTFVVAIAMLVADTMAVTTVDTAAARNLIVVIVAEIEVETVMEVLALAAMEVGS